MTFNLLPVAMRATAILGCNKEFQFLKYLKTVIDDMGRDVPEFEEPVTYIGSIQAVSNKMYQQLGLDLNKNYKSILCPQLMESMAEQIQPDRVVFDNRTYEIIENKNWYNTNGWTRILVVELKELRKNGNTKQLQNPESNIY